MADEANKERKRRVWQWTKLTFEMENRELNDGRILIPVAPPPRMAFSQPKGQINGKSFDAVVRRLDPNMVGQYILEPYEEFFDQIVEMMAYKCEVSFKGLLVEVTGEPDLKVGVVPAKWRPKVAKNPNEDVLEAEIVRLRKQLEDSKRKL